MHTSRYGIATDGIGLLNVPKSQPAEIRNDRLSFPTGKRGAELLEVRLFGQPEAEVDGRPIEVDTRKAVALLAYLTIEGSASRDSVAGLFWAESSQERARATLRRTLSSLRSGIPEGAIRADRERIALIEASSDLARFDDALARTETHDHPLGDVCSRCIGPLTAATDLYRDDFLAGFWIKDAPEFEDWARTVAESYRIRAGDAFHRLAMARAGAGDYPGAIAAVNTWVDHDPLHEPAHRLLMLLNAWAGDKPGAMEAYRSFVAILDRELGVTPLEETTELYEAILDEDLPPAPGMRKRVSVANVGSHAPPPADLIDRTEQLEDLHRAVSLSERSGVVVSLVGKAWMGKTRIIDELVAATPGHLHFRGRSHRMEQELPYAVVAQLLDACADAIRGRDIDVPDWALTEAARITPKLSPGARPAEQDRFGELRLFEAVLTVVGTIAMESPLLIAVDDTQWIDSASAALLGFVAGRTPSGVTLLVARRAEDRDPALALPETTITVDLPPLTTDDIAELTEDPTAVIAGTGGVPLLITEYLAGTGEGSEVGRYIETRLEAIGDLAKQILTTAAVLTGSCDVPLLRDVSGRTEDEVVEAVEELLEGGLLRELSDSAELEFTLDALERVVYDSLKLVRRRLLHRRAGETLAQRPRARTDTRLAAATATQFRGAGDDRAADWYAIAAGLARLEYAHEEARTFYESAIALGSADAALLHLALGEIAITTGDYRQAIAELTAAAGRADGELVAKVEHRLGEVHRLLGRFDAARVHFERSVSVDDGMSESWGDWAMLEHRLGDGDRSLELARRSLDAAAAEGVGSGLGRANSILGVVTRDKAEAMEYLDVALKLSDGDDVARMAALNNKAHLLAELGNADAATKLVQEAVEIADLTGHRHREASLRNHLADLLYGAGRQEEAEEQQRKAAGLFASVGTTDWEPEVWLLSRW